LPTRRLVTQIRKLYVNLAVSVTFYAPRFHGIKIDYWASNKS